MLPTEDRGYAYPFPAVAERLGVSERTVRRMVAAGELPVISVWGRRRVTHRALLAYLDRLETPLVGSPPVGRLQAVSRQTAARRPGGAYGA